MSYRAKCRARKERNLKRARAQFCQEVLEWIEGQDKLPVRERDEQLTITVPLAYSDVIGGSKD